jgi:hypothetical protein
VVVVMIIVMIVARIIVVNRLDATPRHDAQSAARRSSIKLFDRIMGGDRSV